MQVSAARVTAVVLLLSVHFAFFVVFSATYPSPEAPNYYAGAMEFSESRDDLVGSEVGLSGRVVEGSPTVVSTGRGRVVLEGVEGVEKGSRIEVYGVVRGDGVRVLDYVEYTRVGLLYAYVASFVAGLWVLVRILRDWRIGRAGLGRGGDA